MKTRATERGQAMTEYALISAALAGALFLPVFETADGQKISVFLALVNAFNIYLDSFHTVVTLPIP